MSKTRQKEIANKKKNELGNEQRTTMQMTAVEVEMYNKVSTIL